jgi:hypothetical protein
MPVITNTWEAKIRRITVPGEPQQKVGETPISMEKSWAWWCTPVIPASRKVTVQACLGKK